MAALFRGTAIPRWARVPVLHVSPQLSGTTGCSIFSTAWANTLHWLPIHQAKRISIQRDHLVLMRYYRLLKGKCWNVTPRCQVFIQAGIICVALWRGEAYLVVRNPSAHLKTHVDNLHTSVQMNVITFVLSFSPWCLRHDKVFIVARLSAPRWVFISRTWWYWRTSGIKVGYLLNTPVTAMALLTRNETSAAARFCNIYLN